MTMTRRQALFTLIAVGTVGAVALYDGGHDPASAVTELRQASARAGGGNTKTAAARQPHRAAVPSKVRTAVNFAVSVAHRNIPYVWGGNGPDSYDCSGLMVAAYAAAGVYLPRTSEEQWADGVKVSSPQPGDLVYFAGEDGSWDAPGHVAMYLGPHRIVQAYASGYDVMESSYGLPGSLPGVRDQQVVGYTRPVPSA